MAMQHASYGDSPCQCALLIVLTLDCSSVTLVSASIRRKFRTVQMTRRYDLLSRSAPHHLVSLSRVHILHDAFNVL
ncbi:hypothetical protein EDB87DRAFT_1652103 [Lactarius vividus]|nr:hypothetical protein EDB87DRAFT_1652103 [Lactarius vividus]